MSCYDLYVESGPKRRRTMVHVPQLLGCVALGATTDEALAATPDAIHAYARFLLAHGEPVDADAPIEPRVVEHVTEGQWLGQGSPYISFAWDFEPLGDAEVRTYLRRLGWIFETLAGRTEALDAATLGAEPSAGGRPARAILLHVLGATGSYLSTALGSAPGFSRLHGQAERGELDLATALRRHAALVDERVAATTPAEWNAVRELSSGSYTLRKTFRRMLEHSWEHLVELDRRTAVARG